MSIQGRTIGLARSCSRSGAALLATACLTLAAGCGTVTATGQDRTAGQSVVQAQVDNLYDSITGTYEQRTAGEYVTYRLLQDAVQRCVAKAGVNYPRHPFVAPDPAHRATSKLAGTAWLAPVGSDDLLHDAQVDAADVRMSDKLQTYPGSGPQLTGEARRHADHVVDVCANPNNGYAEAFHPQHYYYQLIGAFDTMTASVDAKLASYAKSYANCMHDAGYQVRGYTDVAADVRAKLPGADDIPPLGRSGSGRWQSAKRSGERELAADARCRRPAYSGGVAMLRPLVSEFKVQHSVELHAIRPVWAHIVAKAAAQGLR